MALDSNGRDLAGRDYWESVYRSASVEAGTWQPSGYGSQVIASVIVPSLAESEAQSLCEVGCGNSSWLGYLASRFRIKRIAGIDYSHVGCEQARERLAAQGVSAEIYQADIFDSEAAKIGQFDFVYSLGLVEHFTNLPATIGVLAKFVRPGGVLFTEMPDLRSLYGLASWAMYPSLYRRHCPYSIRDLLDAYVDSGFTAIRAGRLGISCFPGFASPSERRWLRWPVVLSRPLRLATIGAERLLAKLRIYHGLWGISQYIYIIGKHPR